MCGTFYERAAILGYTKTIRELWLVTPTCERQREVGLGYNACWICLETVAVVDPPDEL